MMLTVGENSYMNLEEANAIIENELLDSDEEYNTWNCLSNDSKAKLILRGTRLVDTLPWRGIKYNLSVVGSLQWPRVINNKLIDCPYDIKVGLLLQVIIDYINKGKKETQLMELGVTNYKIKDASITFDSSKVNKVNNINTDIFNTYFKNWIS